MIAPHAPVINPGRRSADDAPGEEVADAGGGLVRCLVAERAGDEVAEGEHVQHPAGVLVPGGEAFTPRSCYGRTITIH
jgi:hypothetical protein